MPIKVKLTKMITAEIEVEIPDFCPHCGTDFSAGAHLREEVLMGAVNYCNVRGGETVAEDYANFPEVQMVENYQCLECGETVVDANDISPPCTHPKGHAADNQGLCHNCGVPMIHC